MGTGHYLLLSKDHLFLRTPGYPAFIAIIFYFFGVQKLNVIVAQLILSAIPTICAYFFDKKIFNKDVGVCAAILLSFDYLLLGYSYLVLTDYIFAVTLSLVFLFGVIFLSSKELQHQYSFLTGLFLALSTLIRPINYYLLFVFFVIFVSHMIRIKMRLQKVLVSLLLFFLSNPSSEFNYI